MKFKKSSKKPASQFPHPGSRRFIDGISAVREVERIAGQVLEGAAAVHSAAGVALTGSRAAAVIPGKENQPFLVAGIDVARKNAPFVIHQIHGGDAAETAGERGASGDPDSGWPGCFTLHAKNVQEAADFALIAHRIAELALIPGLCLQEGSLTARSLQTVQMPDEKLVKTFLGQPDDEIDCPASAQQILFGERRRRIPEWYNIDRPAGSGGVYDPQDAFRAEAARQPFFYQHAAEFAAQAMKEFGDLTGRYYTPLSGSNMEKAEYVLIAQGALVDDALAMAEHWRKSRKLKIGVVNITLARPFPGAEITALLKGKKGATVLEPSLHPFTAEPPLLQEIRAGVDKALENGAGDEKNPPYPGHPVYQKLSDRPAFFSAIYGEGVSFEELTAVVENMLSKNGQKKRYYIGVRFQQPDMRFPKLETLQQKMLKGYPQLSQWSLTGAANGDALPRTHRRVQFQTAAGRELRQAGDWLAQALGQSAFPQIHTNFSRSASPFTRPEVYDLLYSPERDARLQRLSPEIDTLLIANTQFLTDISRLKENGVLILDTPLAPQALWESLSEQLRRQIRQRSIQLFALDAVALAQEIASLPGYVSAAAVQVLAGAFLAKGGGFDKKTREEMLGFYRQRMEKEFGAGYYLVDEIMTALQRGGEAVKKVEWQKLPEFVGLRPLEPEAPWTVRQVQQPDGRVFDLARLWDSAGYIYETGQREQTLTDPFLAADVIPGRSSAFRDMTPYRTQIPKLLAENCTGCGLCWTHCPDSALPAAVQDISTLLNSALERCKAEGQAMVQMQRVAGQLGKQAYKIFSGDDLHQYLTLGDLLQEAFSRLLELMGAKGDQLEALQEEFRHIYQIVQDFPIVRAERFFDEPHRREKGSGALLSIAVNPMSCKACMECVQVCPEDALEAVPQTDDLVAAYRRNWQFLAELPDPAKEQLDQFISDENPDTLVYHLLNKKAYHSLPGGDAAAAGSGVKTAVHLLAAATEALMQPRIQGFIQRLDDLIAKIEDKIQGRLESVVRVNDFEAFGKRLSRITGSDLDAKDLAEALGSGKLQGKLDRAQLKRLNDLLLQLKEIRFQYQGGAHGDGRARMGLILKGAGLSLWSAAYPYNPFPYPWVQIGGIDLSGTAQGLLRGMKRKMAETFKAVRLAEIELQDAYNPREHEPFFREFGPADFTAEERKLCPPLVVLAGAEALGSSAAQDIARLLSGEMPVKIAVINTGTDDIARPDPAAGLLALSRGESFVLQTSAGYPAHFLSGVMEGMGINRPALFHIYACEPHLHGLFTDQAAAQAKLAVDARRFPLFKYHPEAAETFSGRLSLVGNPQLLQDWPEREQEAQDAAGIPAKISLPLTPADWAVNEGRYRAEFKRVPRNRWHGDMTPLEEYLSFSAKERAGREPYIRLFDSQNREIRVVVSEKIVAVADAGLRQWRLLQELAGLRRTEDAREKVFTERELQEALKREKEAIEKEYKGQLSQLDQEHFQVYHQRLTQKLLALSGKGQDAETFEKSLREFVDGGKDGDS